jgi:hypothetical protein
MIRYTVKPDQVAHNEELLQAVFAELDQTQLAGVRYAAFKLEDGVTFIHLIYNEHEKGQSPLSQLDALRAFHLGIRERCDVAPTRTKLSEIGSFRIFGEVGQ